MIPLECLPIYEIQLQIESIVVFSLVYRLQMSVGVIYLSKIDSKHVSLSSFKITQIAFNNDIFLFAFFTIETRAIEKSLALREIDLFCCVAIGARDDYCLASGAPCGWALVRLICMKVVTKILTIQLSHGSKSVFINIEPLRE